MNEITDITRKAIVDIFAMSGQGHWAGRLAEDDFLARLYDLTSLPSTDVRMRNAAGDIFQHRVNFQDWDDQWVFYDERFNLLHEADEVFLRFLCETVHPVVRPNSEEARQLVRALNAELEADGWELVEAKQISGRPIFEPRPLDKRSHVFDEPTGWAKVDRQLQEARMRLNLAASAEQYQAVGLICREVLISVAQEVYVPDLHPSLDGVTPSSTDAERMLGAYFAVELRGGSTEEARAHAKASLRLAVALQHRRTADFRIAALCAEATTSVVNIVAVLAGRRGRSM